MDRRALLTGAAALAAAPMPLLAAPADEVARTSAALNAFLDARYEEELLTDPETLTSLGRKERYGELSDRSDAEAQRSLAQRRKSVAEMKRRFRPERLNEEARTSYEAWAYELEQLELSYRWRANRYALSRGGVHVSLPNFLINEHRVDTRADMEAYISRVRAMPVAFDQVLARARANAAGGVRMPRFSYDQAIDEVGRVTGGAPFADTGKDSALFADGKAKIAALKTAGKITDAEAASLTRDLSIAMTGPLKAGYDRVLAWLKEDREKVGPVAKGAGALPNGRAYYDDVLYLQTTTRMTADEIHRLGLSEVARIRGEMEAVKTQTGFMGSLQEFFQFLRTDRRFYLPNTDEGRAEYLRRADGYLSAMKKKLPQYFGRLPKADLVVKRVEAFREEPGGAQHYMQPALDGSRPGIFYAHLSDMNAMPTYQLENICYHEGVPGHHMQIAIAQELTGIPKFRTQGFYTAYVEGWGLYSEALAREMGFDQDPYDNFGRLAGEIWRAVRLVVDTGIHSKGWSEDEAVKYFLDNSPQPEASVRSEIRRYFLNPGQATCYKIGMLKLQALRDECRNRLGARFDYRAFHDTVLGGGALPLPVLEQRVRRWAGTVA